MTAKNYQNCKTRTDIERLFREYCEEAGVTEQEMEHINRKYRANYSMWSTQHAAFIAGSPSGA